MYEGRGGELPAS
jgi:hypothetical protein